MTKMICVLILLFSITSFAGKTADRKTAGVESSCGFVMRTPTVSPYLNIDNEKPDFCFSLNRNKATSQKGKAGDIEKTFCVAGGAATAAMNLVLSALDSTQKICALHNGSGDVITLSFEEKN